MSMTFSTALLAVTKSGDIISDPSPVEAKTASSLHVLAFSSKGHLLLNESQGAFDFDTWESIRERAYSTCRGAAVAGSDGDIAMGEEGEDGRADGFIREAVEDHLHRDYAWKIDSA
jgi:exosome complex component RRP46